MNKLLIGILFAASSLAAGCGRGSTDPRAEAPMPAQVVQDQSGSVIQVDHPEQFPLATATARTSASQLVVTGVVAPDISRNVPVVTLASGRVTAIHARLGDTVQKGELLLTIRSNDVSGAFSDYRKAVADETLTRSQYDRANDLYAHGAISQNDLQIANDAEEKAKVDLETTKEHLRLLGTDPDNPNLLVDIRAPVSGVITDQQVTGASTVQAYGPNPFTISDLTGVWVICDVYENDLPDVRVGDTAEIRLNAYPDRMLTGRVSNIGAILDPSIRTAKVRIEVRNPGFLRLGMFSKATFLGQRKETHTVIPANAVLHLRDRDWVFVAAGGNRFQRTEIVSGAALPGNMQEVVSGIAPGMQVVTNALVLENSLEQ